MNRSELIAIRLELIRRHFHPDRTPTLVAVTKKRPVEDVFFAYSAGQRDFGENRVDELLEKAEACAKEGLRDIRWHFIGNLQSKKVPKLFQVPNLKAIHSVDSLGILEKMAQREEDLEGNRVDVFLQVNTSNEKEKGGFLEWDDLAKAVNLLLKHDQGPLSLHGLMTMSKLRTQHFEADATKCFEQLKKIRDTLHRDFDLEGLKLSMGMSDDYHLALEAGTNYIRLGSSIFADEIKRD